MKIGSFVSVVEIYGISLNTNCGRIKMEVKDGTSFKNKGYLQKRSD